MGAVAELALGNVGNEFAEACVEMLRRQAPHSDFAQTRRIHDIAGVRKRMQQRADSRVLTLVNGFADLAHSKVQPRVHRIHQR